MRIALAVLFLALNAAAQMREVPSPAPLGSAQASLSSAPDGSVILSWLEKDGKSPGHRLMFARRTRGAWSKPRLIARSSEFVLSWADSPAVVAAAGRLVFAQWVETREGHHHAQDVRITISGDAGDTWGKPFTLHRDGTATEHGFVSLVPQGDGVAVIWLDGRNMKPAEEESGDMSLRFARLNASGLVSDEMVLDTRTCECCHTDMAWTGTGPLVVYRDRSADEVRDSFILRRRGTSWTRPAAIHQDGWKIEGCPVNGPRMDARGSDAVVAWFTGVDSRGRVYVSFSKDAGASFGKPVAIDSGRPLGRVDAVLLADGSALVSWIEQAGGSAEVRVRRVRSEGVAGPLLRIGDQNSARSASIPRMAVAGNEAYLTWTEQGDPARVRVAVLRNR